MAARAVAARHAASLARFSSPTSPTASSLVYRRGMASGGDHHQGPPKVNFWQDPMNPSRWKEEHFVLVSLTGWSLLVYGGYKYFTRGSKDNTGDKVGEA